MEKDAGDIQYSTESTGKRLFFKSIYYTCDFPGLKEEINDMCALHFRHRDCRKPSLGDKGMMHAEMKGKSHGCQRFENSE
jgi:hypothetical protein